MPRNPRPSQHLQVHRHRSASTPWRPSPAPECQRVPLHLRRRPKRPRPRESPRPRGQRPPHRAAAVSPCRHRLCPRRRSHRSQHSIRSSRGPPRLPCSRPRLPSCRCRYKLQRAPRSTTPRRGRSAQLSTSRTSAGIWHEPRADAIGSDLCPRPRSGPWRPTFSIWSRCCSSNLDVARDGKWRAAALIALVLVFEVKHLPYNRVPEAQLLLRQTALARLD